jgi:predicted AlkP superfamily phosphohydrolase/phosphomutase
MGGIDWPTTRAFVQMCDLDGYIRINLRGREAAGFVEPGDEYEELCASIAAGLKTFVDADTGRPLVASITQPRDLYATGAALNGLPDLMIRWDDTPAASHRMVTSPQYGDVPWPMPGKHPQGRSGNHRAEGFLLAAGDAVRAGMRLPDPHILDLAPSVYNLLGLQVPESMLGRPLF